MHDSRDTVIVTRIGEDVDGSDFISYFSKIGEIKTGARSGRQFALMKRIGRKEREGIVTYVNPEYAALAVKAYNETNLKGSVIQVETAEVFYEGKSVPEPTKSTDYCFEELNTAWNVWMGDRLEQCQTGEGGCFRMFRRKPVHDEDILDEVPSGQNGKKIASFL